MLYKYGIVSAYRVDNEHIFSKYDLTSKENAEKYYKNIKRLALKQGGNYRERKYKGNGEYIDNVSGMQYL